MNLIPLILIPICSLLDHLGGQSTVIPAPRILCRVIAIPLAFAIVTHFLCLPNETVGYYWAICQVGMAMFAIPGWASGFCCIPPYNDGRQDTWLGDIVNDMMGVSYLTKLTPSQAKEWGRIYFTLRGLYLYPSFCIFSLFYTPWAMVIGIGCLFMGLTYGNCKTVLVAEYIYGAIIGAMLAGLLLI